MTSHETDDSRPPKPCHTTLRRQIAVSPLFYTFVESDFLIMRASVDKLGNQR